MLFSSMENFIRQPEIRLTMKADKDAESDSLRLIPTTHHITERFNTPPFWLGSTEIGMVFEHQDKLQPF